MHTGATVLDAFQSLANDATMSDVVAAARQPEFGPAEVFRLARILAESGETLEWSGATVADIASTGAPSSLSTLLAPLVLAAGRITVVKLGVPGRPAGGIDVLAQIPGYKVDLDKKKVLRVVEACGYAHFRANETFAPLDSRLFRFRQNSGAQNVPKLAAASLLAKKLACGVRYVGLDIRVAAHGNFGATIEEAKHSAAIFREAAALAGIRAACFYTDARFPYQRYIGRGEALIAVREALTGTSDSLLRNHFDRCRLMAAHIGLLADNPSMPSLSSVSDVFRRNLQAQGTSWDAFEAAARGVETQHLHVIEAADPGFAQIDLDGLRDVFGRFNSTGAAGQIFPDTIGVILRVDAGEFVEKGATLLTVRSIDSIWPDLRAALSRVARTSQTPKVQPGLECESRD